MFLQLCTGMLCVLPFAACEQPVCTAYTELSEAYESHDVHKLEMVAAKYEQLFARVSTTDCTTLTLSSQLLTKPSSWTTCFSFMLSAQSILQDYVSVAHSL